MGFYSYSQEYRISRNDLIGKWYSLDEYKRIKDSVTTIKNFNIEFLNSNSLRFILHESNPMSKISFSYELDTLYKFQLITYYQPEVSTIHKMVLLPVNRDTIYLFVVLPENLDHPLKVFNETNNSTILKKSKNN
jgi:hypothetical protein